MKNLVCLQNINDFFAEAMRPNFLARNHQYLVIGFLYHVLGFLGSVPSLGSGLDPVRGGSFDSLNILFMCRVGGLVGQLPTSSSEESKAVALQGSNELAYGALKSQRWWPCI